MLYCSMFRGSIPEWTENRLGARNCCHRSAVWPSPFNLCTAVSSPGNEDWKDHLHHPSVHLSVRPGVEGWISPLNTSGPMAEEQSSPPHGGEPRDTSVTLLSAVHPPSHSRGDALRTGIQYFVFITQAGSLADQSSRHSTLMQCQDPCPFEG